MKKIALLSVFTFLFAAFSFAQTKPATPTTKKVEDVIQFTETVHDFGKIKQGVPVTYDFQFKNLTKQPVVIESATASCGCTTPVKPEQPVMKGKKGVIKAGFNAAAAGPFDKSIHVKVAGIDQPMDIRIKGEVVNN